MTESRGRPRIAVVRAPEARADLAPLTAPPPWRFSTAWIATWLTVPAR
jgi:hypothetical protein